MAEEATRQRLIDAAEQVFARDGFERASLREIMRVADANPAAVHYHFHGKEGLLEAVLDRVVEPIIAGRLARLEALRADHREGPLPLRPLVEAFLAPDVEAIGTLLARGPGRAAVVGRAYARPTEHVRAIMRRQFDPVGAVYVPAIAEALGDRDPSVVAWRVRWCVVGVIVALFNGADDPDGPYDRADPDATLQRAVDFVVAGLEAPT